MDKPVDFMKYLAPGSGEAVKRIGIGLERVCLALYVDHGSAFEWAQQVDVIGAKELLHSVGVSAVDRGLLEILQSDFDRFAARDHRHSAGAIVGNVPMPTSPFGKRVTSQEVAEPLCRNASFFGCATLVAGLA